MAITKDMTIQQIVGEHPEAVRVFFQHGLMCVGCAAARFESLDQGAKAHGIDADVLVADLNTFLEAQTTQATA
jgi:hybrid cluster-associated redox disulfide protein